MTPVLIFTDTEKIADEQAVLGKVVTLYQSVYTAIKAVGITPTIAEIDTLVQNTKRKSTANFVNDYIVGKLLDAAAPYVFNGITFTRDAVKNMIAVPDTTAIKNALQPSLTTFTQETNGARLNLLSLAEDVISEVSDAATQIETLYTYYTANDASTAIATGLQAVCDVLNTFDTSNNSFFLKQTPPGDTNVYGQRLGNGSAIPGLQIRNNAFVISLEFIRKFEQSGTLFFSKTY